MKKYCLILIFIAAACTKNAAPVYQPAPVIESYLLPGQPVFVKINWVIPWGASFDTLLPLENLSPVLVQNQTAHSLTYMGKGVYGNAGISLQDNDSCHLYFEHNGKMVSAHTVIPGKPTGFVCDTDTVRRLYLQGLELCIPAAVKFNWDNPGNDYHFMVLGYRTAKPWWGPPLDIQPSYIHHTKPTKETTAWLQSADDIYQGISKVNLYRILPDYAMLFNETHRSLLGITAPPHNIINGYGVFTGMNISDTIFIEREIY